MRGMYILVLTLVFACAIVKAQEAPRTLLAGLLNGRAISMPKPEYPEEARAARVGGLVGVNVLVDENGRVVSADAEATDQRTRLAPDGTKLDPVPVDRSLQAASEAAARQAVFAPVKLKGVPVRVRGKITYNFIADDSDRPPRVGDIYGPLLNEKAVSLPQPDYPAAAKAAKVQGTVTVHITVDEAGAVVAAKANSGHPLLRSAAEEAAMRATFKRLLFGDDPIRYKGVVSYDFVIGKNTDN